MILLRAVAAIAAAVTVVVGAAVTYLRGCPCGGMKRPLNRYRFLTYKCRRWLPCKSGKGPFHTYHLLLVIPPLRKAPDR